MFANISTVLLKLIFFVMVSQIIRMLMPSATFEGESCVIVGMDILYILIDGIRNVIQIM